MHAVGDFSMAESYLPMYLLSTCAYLGLDLHRSHRQLLNRSLNNRVILSPIIIAVTGSIVWAKTQVQKRSVR